MLILSLLFIFLFILYIRLSSRLTKCEEQLKGLKIPETPKVVETPKISQPAAPKTITERKPFKVPNIIKENWMGVFGSVAIVIGAAFFGLTSEIMQRAEARVGLMLAVSLVLFIIGQKIKHQKQWETLSGWLNSIAGAIILFATLGAGGIKQLQFIETPIYAFLFLLFGISVNIFLALRSQSEPIASLHVILSILALCIAPQTPILLPLGALIAIIGLIASYRSRWDLHLLLIVTAFSFQNTIWTASQEMTIWMQYMAIGCSLAVALSAGLIHYSKKYSSTKLEVIPLVAHISNWGLLTWNVWIHSEAILFAPLVLACVSIAGFLLARIAKKKEIIWLYHTDTLLAQLVAMGAIASLSSFSANYLDLCLIVFIETLIFNFICRLQKEDLLLRAGYCLQYIVYLITAGYTLYYLNLPGDHLPIYFRMGLIASLSWGFHLSGAPVDDYRFIGEGTKDQKNPVSIMSIFGALFFIGIYLFGYERTSIQLVTLLGIAAIGYFRKYRETPTINLVFIIPLIFVHVMNWLQLDSQIHPTLRLDHIGIIILDVLIIAGNFYPSISNYVIYALGLHIAMLTLVFAHKTSIGFIFLGISGLALLISRFKINESLLHVGYIFLIAFVLRFMLISLPVELRRIAEVLGSLVIIMWLIAYPTKNMSRFTQYCGYSLIEIGLFFASLCILSEVHTLWLPTVWISIALGLILGCRYYGWPVRIYFYAWLYFLLSLITDLYSYQAFIAMALQLTFAQIAFNIKEKFANPVLQFIYNNPIITILLPAFFSAALLFTLNFEKAILTLLLVGLICVYFAFGLLVKSKRAIQFGMIALAFCSIRLVVFDLVQTDPLIRALVFIGVGSLMLGISVLYKKYKHRLQ